MIHTNSLAFCTLKMFYFFLVTEKDTTLVTILQSRRCVRRHATNWTVTLGGFTITSSGISSRRWRRTASTRARRSTSKSERKRLVFPERNFWIQVRFHSFYVVALMLFPFHLKLISSLSTYWSLKDF